MIFCLLTCIFSVLPAEVNAALMVILHRAESCEYTGIWMVLQYAEYTKPQYFLYILQGALVAIAERRKGKLVFLHNLWLWLLSCPKTLTVKGHLKKCLQVTAKCGKGSQACRLQKVLVLFDLYCQRLIGGKDLVAVFVCVCVDRCKTGRVNQYLKITSKRKVHV